VVFGVWKGALSVSVNSQAITVEEAMGRPINSSFQGFWSLGSLCAASSLGGRLEEAKIGLLFVSVIV
jgi:hypothetical protein